MQARAEHVDFAAAGQGLAEIPEPAADGGGHLRLEQRPENLEHGPDPALDPTTVGDGGPVRLAQPAVDGEQRIPLTVQGGEQGRAGGLAW